MRLTTLALAVLCAGLFSLNAQVVRTRETVLEELKEARNAYNELRWQEGRKLADKYCAADPEYQKLMQAQQEAEANQITVLRELTEAYPEGKELYSRIDSLEAEVKAARDAKEWDTVKMKQTEWREAISQLNTFQREKEIRSWKNEAFRPVADARNKAMDATWTKCLSILEDHESDEARQFAADVKAAEARVKELNEELKAFKQ